MMSVGNKHTAVEALMDKDRFAVQDRIPFIGTVTTAGLHTILIAA